MGQNHIGGNAVHQRPTCILEIKQILTRLRVYDPPNPKISIHAYPIKIKNKTLPNKAKSYQNITFQSSILIKHKNSRLSMKTVVLNRNIFDKLWQTWAHHEKYHWATTFPPFHTASVLWQKNPSDTAPTIYKHRIYINLTSNFN